jgi:hypothetical protein
VRKFIKLFEEYTKSEKAESSETSTSWNDVRDAIQMKMPYLIVTFNTADGYNLFISKFLANKEYVKQSFFSSIDGQMKTFPSIFMMDTDQNGKNSIKKYYDKQYAVRHIVLNEMNGENATMYFSDGSSTNIGNEIVTAIDPSDMQRDNHYQLAATYYKFIEA